LRWNGRINANLEVDDDDDENGTTAGVYLITFTFSCQPSAYQYFILVYCRPAYLDRLDKLAVQSGLTVKFLCVK
jgi:hypothetical protein